MVVAESKGTLRERFGVAVAKGNVLVREGDPGGELFVVLSGRVEQSVGEQLVADVGPGEVIGVTSCFTGHPHTATSTATEDAFVLRLRNDQVDELVRAQPRFAIVVIEALVSRLRGATERALGLAHDEPPETDASAATEPPAPSDGLGDGEVEGGQEPGDRREAD